MAKNRTSWTSATTPAHGRNKGSRNKVTKAILDNMLQVLAYYNSEGRLKEDLDAMTPYMRRKIIEGLAKHHLPTLSQNDNNNINDGQIEITVSYEQPKMIDVDPKPVDELPDSNVLNNIANPEKDIIKKDNDAASE